MKKDEKLREATIKTDNKFLRWLDNYWYHYKWTTIVVAFFVIVVLVCTVQMCSNEKEDITVLYSGPVQMSSEELENFKSVMNFIMPEDFDGNGKKQSGIVNYHIYSEDQIKAIEAQTDAAGVRGYVDRSYNSNNYDTYYNYIQTGDVSICFVDPALYENLKTHNRLMKVSDIIGYTPDGAVDEYGVRIGDIALYDSYGSMRVIPEDTVVCILRPVIMIGSKSGNSEMYEYEKQMFRAILEFGAE